MTSHDMNGGVGMAQAIATREVVFTPKSQRAGGIAGIVFSLALAIDIFFLPGASFTDPIADIREFFVDNANLILVAAWAEAILFTFVFMYFGACLRDTLAWSETVPTEFPRLTFAGSIMAAALVVAAAIPWSAVALADGAVDDGLLLFVMHMDAVAYGLLFSVAFALVALAASVVILRTGALARWLGWLGSASAAALVIGGLWMVSGNETGPFAIVEYVGLTAWIVWSLGVGIDMVRRSRVS